MTAAALDLPDITIGDDFAHTLDFVQADETTAFPLTGRTYRAQARIAASSVDAAVTFTLDTSDLAGGVIVLHLSHAETAQLAPGTLRWDLEETASGVVTTLLAGSVRVLRDNTR